MSANELPNPYNAVYPVQYDTVPQYDTIQVLSYSTVHVPGTVPGKESITSTDVISYCDVLDVY